MPLSVLHYLKKAIVCVVCMMVFLSSAMPSVAMAEALLSQERDAAVVEGSDFALSGFHKAKRGSSSALTDGRDVGYRFITGDEKSVVALAAGDVLVVYVSEDVCRERGIDLTDANTQTTLLECLEVLDKEHSDGGEALQDLAPEVVWTTKRSYQHDGLEFNFAISSQGRSYSAVADLSDPEKSSAVVSFCDYASLVDASEVVPASDDFFTQMREFFEQVDWSPLWVSLRTALLATVFVAILGVLVAWKTMGVGDTAKSVIDALSTLSMVLPPTIIGLILLYIFGKNSPTGEWLISIGLNIPFTWPAAVIAATVVAFPFMYRVARGAFEGLPDLMLDCARTLGWSEWRIFRKLMMPLCAAQLASGVVLSFARALGEFGATMFFAGNYAGETETLPIAIYYDWMAGDTMTAWLWVLVVMGFSLIIMVAVNMLTQRK